MPKPLTQVRYTPDRETLYTTLNCTGRHFVYVIEVDRDSRVKGIIPTDVYLYCGRPSYTNHDGQGIYWDDTRT